MNSRSMLIYPLTAALIVAAVYLLISLSNPKQDNPNEDELKLDVRFITTPMNVVDEMLKMASLKKDDVVFDLGCGDGRIIIEAARQYGVSGIGFDLDMERVMEARENAKKAEVDHLVKIQQANIFDLDLTKADVILMYLLPELNVRLIPQLEQMKRGSRIVSHNFNMEGIIPDYDKVVKHERNAGDPYEIYGENDNLDASVIYLWTIPLNKVD